MQADSDFTGRLFDCCGLLSVGDDERAGRRRRVEAFLDKKRLQPGRPFATDFVAALATSKVALPIVSRGSLEPMAQLTSGAPCDNVLLEWSVMVECRKHTADSCQLLALMVMVDPRRQPLELNRLLLFRFSWETWTRLLASRCQ